MKEILNYGTTYHSSNKLDPYRYVNLDFVRDKYTQRSIKGNLFFVTDGLVFWETKWQETVTIFTVEAKYIAFIWAT